MIKKFVFRSLTGAYIFALQYLPPHFSSLRFTPAQRNSSCSLIKSKTKKKLSNRFNTIQAECKVLIKLKNLPQKLFPYEKREREREKSKNGKQMM